MLQMAVRLEVLEQAVGVLPNCTLEYQNKVNCPIVGKNSSVMHSLSSVLVPMWPPQYASHSIHLTTSVSHSIALQVLAAMKARLLDFDDKVRAAAVEAACKVAKARPQVCFQEASQCIHVWPGKHAMQQAAEPCGMWSLGKPFGCLKPAPACSRSAPDS